LMELPRSGTYVEGEGESTIRRAGKKKSGDRESDHRPSAEIYGGGGRVDRRLKRDSSEEKPRKAPAVVAFPSNVKISGGAKNQELGGD